LLAKFDYSPVNLVTSVLASHKWQPWKFNAVPKGYWQDRNNLIQYLEWLGGELGFKTTEDWYKLSVADLRAKDGPYWPPCTKRA